MEAGIVASGQAEPDLSEFKSLEDAYRAVDAAADCDEVPPDPPTVHLPDGGATGKARMCTGSVALFWFGTDQERMAVHTLLAAAAAPSDGKWVYFAEGKNWFLADISDVQAGSEPDRRVDVAGVAAMLGARYTGAEGSYVEVRMGSVAGTVPVPVPTPDPLSGEVGKDGEMFLTGVRAHSSTLTPARVGDEQLLEIGSLACISPDDQQKQRKYREFWIQRGFTGSEVLAIFAEARVMC